MTPRDENLRDYKEDLARQERKDRLERHLSEMWPLRKPARYQSEEQLYSDLRMCLESFWDPPDIRYFDVMTSTILFSYRVGQFETTPYPFLFGPKGSGKSRGLNLLRVLAYNPIKSSSLSPAAIYQVIDKWHPTLLIDETDKWGIGNRNGPGEQVLAILSVLNSGYQKGDYAIRASRDGSDPIVYDLFGLKVLAGTEPLPDTLADRTIRMDMERNEKEIPLEMDSPVFEELRNQLETYHISYNGMTGKDWPTPPREIDVDPETLKEEIGDNRVTELFYPLYGVCPSDRGRRNLFELARETVKDREADEGTGDLSQVLDAVAKIWNAERTLDKTTVTITIDAIAGRFENDYGKPDGVKSLNSWIGRRLSKLQFKPTFIENRTRRGIEVSEAKLYTKARRYRRDLARELSKASKASDPIVKQQDASGPSDASTEKMPHIIKKPYKCLGCKETFPNYQVSLGHNCETPEDL